MAGARRGGVWGGFRDRCTIRWGGRKRRGPVPASLKEDSRWKWQGRRGHLGLRFVVSYRPKNGLSRDSRKKPFLQSSSADLYLGPQPLGNLAKTSSTIKNENQHTYHYQDHCPRDTIAGPTIAVTSAIYGGPENLKKVEDQVKLVMAEPRLQADDLWYI